MALLLRYLLRKCFVCLPPHRLPRMKYPSLILLAAFLTGTIPLPAQVVPQITATPGSLSGFATPLNTPSAAQTFSLGGSDFEGPVTLTAPAGFEVSLDGVHFRRSQVYGQGGTLQNIYTDDFSTHSGKVWYGGSGRQFPNGFAFAALQSDGSVKAWGDPGLGGNSSAYTSELASGVRELFSHYAAFAALKDDGSVVVWGYPDGAGGSGPVAGQLTSGVETISSTYIAFAALKSDGSVVTWGSPSHGGDSSAVSDQLASGVTAVYSTQSAFAALKSDGSVVTWGESYYGGDSSAVSSQLALGVKAIYSSSCAFAALKTDGSVVTWGDAWNGGNSSAVSSQLASGVTAVYSTAGAFAALKTDGSVVTWGPSESGGDSSAVTSQLASGVTAVYSNGNAFAALKSNGSVVTWGEAYYGGDSSAVTSQLALGVTAIYSTAYAFAALKTDGSVVTWGAAGNGGNSSAVSGLLASGVMAVYSTEYAFAALKSDGSVVTWGVSSFGGDSSAVSSQLASGVTAVYSAQYAFVAVKGDGSVVTWGESYYGGSGAPANIGASVVTVPVDIDVRLAASSTAGAVSGSLVLSSLGATDVSVSLSGTVGATLPDEEIVSTTVPLTASEGLTGGGQIYRPMPGVINAANQVAFKAFGAIGTGGIEAGNDSLLLTDSSGSLRVIAREGAQVDVSPATSLLGLLTEHLLTEDGQTVAFDRITGSSTPFDQAYVSSGDGQTLETLVRTGASAAGGGLFKAPTPGFVADGDGRVYFVANLSGTGVTPRNDSGLWQDDAGVQTLVAREGSDVSSVTTDAAWLGMVLPRVSAAGDGAAFVAFLQNNPSNSRQRTDAAKNLVVLDGNENGLSLVARKGDVVPDTSSATLVNVFGVSRSATGAHAVLGLLKFDANTTRNNDLVLVSVSGGTKRLVAQEGVTSIGGSLVRNITEYYAVGNDGVIFLTDSALCRWTVAGGISVLAQTGSAAPGTAANFTRMTSLSVSEGGAVALLSMLSNGRTGLWRALPGDSLSLVLTTATTTTVNGTPRTVLAMGLHRSAGTAGAGGGAGAAINDAGTIFATLSVGSGLHVARRFYP